MIKNFHQKPLDSAHSCSGEIRNKIASLRKYLEAAAPVFLSQPAIRFFGLEVEACLDLLEQMEAGLTEVPPN